MSEFPTYQEFVSALYGNGYRSYVWQDDLASMLYEGTPPDEIVVEPGMGKSSFVDAWIWAFARQRHEICIGERERTERTVSMRLHMVVDRRVIVDEVYDRAERIQTRLDEVYASDAGREVLAIVAHAFKDNRPNAGGDHCLGVINLRGGLPGRPSHTIYPHIPTVATCTIDMFGSRLLWRGYGVTKTRRPIDAALTGADTTIVLDEAHLAGQLRRTLELLQEEFPKRGLDGVLNRHVVTMTATPVTGNTQSQGSLRLDRRKELEKNPDLERRFANRDGVTIKVVGANRAGDTALSAAVEQAIALYNSGAGLHVVIFVNTPQQASDVAVDLRHRLGEHQDHTLANSEDDGVSHEKVTVLHGRLDDVRRGLAVARLGGLKPGADLAARAAAPAFVVATQTLEVGADLDFDYVVTLGCSLDAFVQRAGRCNRIGTRDYGSVVVVPENEPSPLYKNTAPKAVKKLKTLTNLGSAITAYESATSTKQGEALDDLIRHTKTPVTLDRVVFTDYLVTEGLTNEPAVGRWLRDDPSTATVDVVYSSALGKLPVELWCDYISVVPPGEWETSSIPWWEVKKLLDQRKAQPGSDECIGVRIRRKDRVLLKAGSVFWSLKPGDIVILVRSGDEVDLSACGREDQPMSVVVTDQEVLRKLAAGGCPETHAKLVSILQEHTGLVEYPDFISRIGENLRGGEAGEDENRTGSRDQLLAHVQQRREELAERIVALLDGSGDAQGDVLVPRYLKALSETIGEVLVPPPWLVLVINRSSSAEQDPARGAGAHGARISIRQHNNDVGRRAKALAEEIGLQNTLVDVLEASGLRHDIGKEEEHEQLALCWEGPGRGFIDTPQEPLAKSGIDRRYWNVSLRVARVPVRLRHEALSAAKLIEDKGQADLECYLVGTHHGYGRGLFPPLDPQDLERGIKSVSKNRMPCFLQDANDVRWGEWAERFLWLNERYGPYRLALLEAVLRLADWQCSAESDEEPDEEPKEGDDGDEYDN